MHLIKLGLVYAACVLKLCVILYGPVVLPTIFAVFAVLANFEGAIFTFVMSYVQSLSCDVWAVDACRPLCWRFLFRPRHMSYYYPTKWLYVRRGVHLCTPINTPIFHPHKSHTRSHQIPSLSGRTAGMSARKRILIKCACRQTCRGHST